MALDVKILLGRDLEVCVPFITECLLEQVSTESSHVELGWLACLQDLVGSYRLRNDVILARELSFGPVRGSFVEVKDTSSDRILVLWARNKIKSLASG